jgi:hypothetical protein
MSSNPVIIVDGKYIETLDSYDYKSYLAQHYPGAEYRWENGYMLHITVGKEKSK